MTHILHIETATEVCSVAISDKDKLLALKSASEKNIHSTKLSTFVDELLKKANLNIDMIDAVCVSKGPGSFTGLRIGIAVAKGITYGLNKPLISVDTLKSLAFKAISREKNSEILYCPLIDARINEVYFALYDVNLNEILTTSAGLIEKERFDELLKENKILFFGEKTEKWIAKIKDNSNVLIARNIQVSAENMISIAYQKFSAGEFEDIRFFEPFYLKDFKAKKFSEKLRKILYDSN